MDLAIGSPDSGGPVVVTGRELAEGVLWVLPARFQGWVGVVGWPAARAAAGPATALGRCRQGKARLWQVLGIQGKC
jgi:hypothetical protein